MADAELILDVLREVVEAEAAYRSAMHIYKDHPSHRTRIYAECRWKWAMNNARCVLGTYDPQSPAGATADVNEQTTGEKP